MPLSQSDTFITIQANPAKPSKATKYARIRPRTAANAIPKAVKDHLNKVLIT